MVSNSALSALVCLVSLAYGSSADLSVSDPAGYVTFCPCMGRFGNQVDHYLGAMAFAKGLNRTLLLPPWVEYRRGQPKSIQVPFSAYFSVSAVNAFHRAAPLEDFLSSPLSSSLWPQGSRTSLCYSPRRGAIEGDCNAKEGNPFGSFWDSLGVDFDGSATYGPLTYDVSRLEVRDSWSDRFPPSAFPVLAFTGAPAYFPLREEHVGLQKYLKWSKDVIDWADDFIREHLSPRGKFVGIHLRNGADWRRACDLVPDSANLFSSAQCLGYRNEKGPLTEGLCRPSEEAIVKHLRRVLKRTGAGSVFVATDDDAMLDAFSRHFGRSSGVAFVTTKEDSPHLDLAVLGRADHFVGNCVSSFSAFVKRERDVAGLQSSFWGFPAEKKRQGEDGEDSTHDPGEL